MEKRYCEICGHLIGTMSEEAWIAGDRLCSDCIEKEAKEFQLQEDANYMHDQAKYAYACGYHD